MRISDWSSDVCSSDLQLLAERKELNTDYGRMAFAILLFQDLVAIPLLAAIPLLGGDKEQTLTWPIALQAIGTLALVVIGDRKSVVWGRSVSVRLDHGGGWIMYKKNTSTKDKNS